ncbi:MAG: hypothetical protein HKN79_03405, partial [Flavobacteriales bacterium]|nr:hypothetical protein [Flavobacteriales bacterium]
MGSHITSFSLILIGSILFWSCGPSPSDTDRFSVNCSAEQLTPDGKKLQAEEDPRFIFTGGESRSEQTSRTGTYSLALHSEQQFGFSFKVEGAEPGDRFTASVYYKSTGPEGLLIGSSDDFWYKATPAGEADDEGWQKLYLDFYVPPTFSSDEIKIYAWNPDTATVYFDDMTISKVDPGIKATYGGPSIYLYINEGDMAKLEEIRKEAIEDGILRTTDESWVKALFFYGEDMQEAKVRYKGDWTDHLLGKKRSLRIKLKEGSWKGMRTFSIQSPKSRSFLNEWFAHQIFESEDVLTTRYGFVPVYLNNENLGLFAYEEHFEKQLVESRDRREGPILKLSEDQLWEANLHGTAEDLPLIESARIVPFKMNKMLLDSGKTAQFLVAQDILERFHSIEDRPLESLDREKWARYMALMDITKGYHGATWHNQRYYYNPIQSQVEPIAYDLYIDAPVDEFMKDLLIGRFDPETYFDRMEGMMGLRNLLVDTAFMSLYLEQLDRYLDPEFLRSHLEEHRSYLDSMTQVLNQEFPGYRFDKEFFEENIPTAARARKGLQASTYAEVTPEVKGRSDYEAPYILSSPPYFVTAFQHSVDSVHVFNYYPEPIEITGLILASEEEQTL